MEEKLIQNQIIIRPQQSPHTPKVFLEQKKHTQKTRKDLGQASIEFILTITFSLGFTFLFVSHGFNTAKGYIAHYASFMASRAFLVSNEKKAKDTFNFYTQGLDLGEVEIKASPYMVTGAILKFDQALSPLPWVGGSGEARFLSESFLGKEPTRDECFSTICSFMGVSCDNFKAITVMDNGC